MWRQNGKWRKFSVQSYFSRQSTILLVIVIVPFRKLHVIRQLFIAQIWLRLHSHKCPSDFIYAMNSRKIWKKSGGCEDFSSPFILPSSLKVVKTEFITIIYRDEDMEYGRSILLEWLSRISRTKERKRFLIKKFKVISIMFHLRTQFGNYNLHQKCRSYTFTLGSYAIPRLHFTYSSTTRRFSYRDREEIQGQKNLWPLEEEKNSMQLDRSIFYLFRKMIFSAARRHGSRFFCRLICWLSRFFLREIVLSTRMNREIMTMTSDENDDEKICVLLRNHENLKSESNQFFISSFYKSEKIFCRRRNFHQFNEKFHVERKFSCLAQMKGFLRQQSFPSAAAAVVLMRPWINEKRWKTLTFAFSRCRPGEIGGIRSECKTKKNNFYCIFDQSSGDWKVPCFINWRLLCSVHIQ